MAFRVLTKTILESAQISGLSPSELAKETGVSCGAITHAMRRHGIRLDRKCGSSDEAKASLPGFFLNALDAFCKQNDLTRQEVLRAALAEYMIKHRFNPYLWEGKKGAPDGQ